MRKTVQCQLQLIDSLIKNKDFEKAFSDLRNLSTMNMVEGDRAWYYLLTSEAKLRLGIYDFEKILQIAIEYFINNHDDLKLAKAKFISAWVLISKGDHFDAREVLLEAYLLYKRYDDKYGQANALNRLSLLCFQLGEIESAFTYLQRSIDTYDSLNDPVNKFIVSNNLALLYYATGHLRKSISLFGRIGMDISEWRSKKNVAIFYFQSPIPYALSGNFDIAKNTLLKARDCVNDFPRERAIYFENLGWIHLLEEDYQSAEKALLQGLKISLEIAPKSALISQIKRRLADAYFGLGQFEKAKKYADEAMVVAEHINERVEIAACWRVYAQLEAKDGNEPAARQWFTKAIDMFAMISSRYELAATRYLAAVSGMYHNGERQALLYLAREYFESEEVRHYVEKIDREIKRTRNLPMPRRVDDNGRPPAIVTVNPKMKKLVELAEHVALADMNVLLTGPTGTGKDLLARFIHYHSGRKGKFIPVNSAAIPDPMIESELFGYKKGAYTGADHATTGLIECAEGGTFYLNEIADASPEMQAKLLDVIENRTVRRLGEREARNINFRLIAATNHDLEQMIRDGKFRADLYHRLNEIPITLPSLADRKEDIPTLLRHFLSKAKININGDSGPQAIDRLAEVLSGREWPGNVREFEAGIKRLIFTAKGDLARMIAAAKVAMPPDAEQLLVLLQKHNWNRRVVAGILGVSEGTIRHRIKKLGITIPTA